MQILRTIKSWYGRGNSAWDGDSGLDKDLVHIDNHLPNITYAGAIAAGTATSAAPASMPGRAQLFADGTYAVTSRSVSGTLMVCSYSAKAGALASDGLAVLINTGSGWVSPFSTLAAGSIPLSALQAGALPANITIDSVQVSTGIPASNIGDVIIVRSPHMRQMVWNGTTYVRAPWHQPGMVQYSIDNPSSIPGYLPVRGDVVYAQSNYPDLISRLGLSGVGNFSLVELRGEFIRCLDNGRGVDAGRSSGSAQDGTWLRTTAQEWSGSDLSAGNFILGNAFAQAEVVMSSIGSGGVTPPYAKSPGNVPYNAATTDNGMAASVGIDSGSSINTWINFRPRNIALPAWVSY